MKRLLRFTALFLCIFSLSANALSFAENEDIQIWLNGNRLNTSIQPIIKNGTTLVPMRDIFQALGMKIKWDENTKTVTGEGEDTVVKLIIGSDKAYVNGKEKKLAISSEIINGSTVVPLRFISEAAGCDVKWDDKERKIIITMESENDIYMQSTDMKANSKALYAVDGTGKYVGYQRLKGYPNEDKFAIYFQGGIDGSIVSFNTTYEDLRKIDLNEIVEWRYEGKTYRNTRKTLYSLFSDTSGISGSLGIKGDIISTEWFIQTFGDVYIDWMEGIAYSQDAARLVDAYFEQLINKQQSNKKDSSEDQEVIEYIGVQEENDQEKEDEELMRIIDEMLEQGTSVGGDSK